MKLSSQLALLKQQKKSGRTEPPPRQQPPRRQLMGRFSRGHWAWLVLGLVATGGASWEVLEWFVWNQLPPALVGTWEVTEGPLARGTFAFARSGAVEIRGQDRGTEYVLNGRAVLNDKTLSTTTRSPQTGQEQTRKSTMRELTPQSLVLELEGGGILRMARRR